MRFRVIKPRRAARHPRRSVLAGLLGEPLERREMLATVTFPVEHSVQELGRRTYGIEAADIDGDQDVDVVATISNRDFRPVLQLVWYANTDAAGTFGKPVVVSEEIVNPVEQLSIYDTNLDGDADILIVERDVVSWFENLDGAGTFSERRILLAEDALAADLGDLDSDGDLDMIVLRPQDRNKSGGLWWYQNTDGEMTFGAGQQILYDRYIGSTGAVAIADVNRDGYVDIVSASGRDIRWHKNSGHDVEFSLSVIGESNSSFIELHDIDGDGDNDIVSGAPGIVWYENGNGVGDFQQRHWITRQADTRYDFDVADLDGDGDQDFLTADVEVPRIPWYENIDRGYVISRRMSVVEGIRSGWDVTAADLDGDGDQDVIYTAENKEGTEHSIYWRENRVIGDSNDDGVFDSEDLIEVLAAGWYERTSYGTIISYNEGDWDQDGDFDSNDLIFALAGGHYAGDAAIVSTSLAAAIGVAIASEDAKRAFVG